MVHMTTAMNPQTTGRWHEWTRADRFRAARESMPGRPDQGQFADIAIIHRNTVGKYEKPNFDGYTRKTVKLWAFATGFDFEWLWDGAIPENATNTPTDDGGGASARDVSVTRWYPEITSFRLIDSESDDLATAA